MKPSKRARRRARGRAIAGRPPYSAAAMAWGHWRTVDIARAGGFQAYQRKWAFLFADEADCFDCGLSQEEARDELQRIRSLLLTPATPARHLSDAQTGGSLLHQLPPAAATRSRSPRQTQLRGNPPTLRSAGDMGFTLSTGTSTS